MLDVHCGFVSFSLDFSASNQRLFFFHFMLLLGVRPLRVCVKEQPWNCKCMFMQKRHLFHKISKMRYVFCNYTKKHFLSAGWNFSQKKKKYAESRIGSREVGQQEWWCFWIPINDLMLTSLWGALFFLLLLWKIIMVLMAAKNLVYPCRADLCLTVLSYIMPPLYFTSMGVIQTVGLVILETFTIHNIHDQSNGASL